jgi:hypothetical protein
MASTPLPSDSPVNTILSAVANRLRSGSSPATETDSTPEAIPDVEENNATTDATIDANEISDATTVNPTATDETTIDDVNTL